MLVGLWSEPHPRNARCHSPTSFLGLSDDRRFLPVDKNRVRGTTTS